LFKTKASLRISLEKIQATKFVSARRRQRQTLGQKIARVREKERKREEEMKPEDNTDR